MSAAGLEKLTAKQRSRSVRPHASAIRRRMDLPALEIATSMRGCAAWIRAARSAIWSA